MLASRYRLVRLLGRGGMGEVYEAIDGVLGRRVAVKVFRGETDLATSRARQQLEIQALARLQHPNIVAVFDAGTDAGISFVVMQLIDGVTLAERIRASALPPAEAARVGWAIADALAHVHAFGMVHRDIKPGNILCGANGTVFLTDFGIVRLIGRTRLTQGTIGTVSYLAPEQVRGEDVGTAADIYALGLVLLECLTGAPEYPGGSAESAVARLTRPPRVPPAVPQGWSDLLTAMTTADPAARPTAGEVARILHEAPATSPPTRTLGADESPTRVRTKPITIAAPMPTASSVPIRHRQRRAAAWLTAAGVFAAVLIIAALVWLLPRIGSSPSSGQQAPTMSPGPDRLRQDLQDLQSAVQP